MLGGGGVFLIVPVFVLTEARNAYIEKTEEYGQW